MFGCEELPGHNRKHGMLEPVCKETMLKYFTQRERTQAVKGEKKIFLPLCMRVFIGPTENLTL